MRRQALRAGHGKRRRDGAAALRTVAEWLAANNLRYCKTDNRGVQWRSARNRGVPPLMVMSSPPRLRDVPGVAIYMWPGGYAQITKAQDYWIKHFDKAGWCVILAHSADEVLEMLRKLGYGPLYVET